MDKTLQIQAQIRQNAEEISVALSEINKWEKIAKKKDSNLKDHGILPKPKPIRSGAGTVPIKSKFPQFVR